LSEFKRLLPSRHHACSVVRMNDFGPTPVHRFFRCLASHFIPSGVEVVRTPIGAARPNHRGQGIGQLREIGNCSTRSRSIRHFEQLSMDWDRRFSLLFHRRCERNRSNVGRAVSHTARGLARILLPSYRGTHTTAGVQLATIFAANTLSIH
jgi:hypothetical protein